jgi:tetratricopeptide (TPR) repeat protein
MENREMARSFNPGHTVLGVTLLAGALLVGSAVPAAAQEVSGRMRVLVPAFVGADGKSTRTGERLADQVRRAINQLPTHAPTESKDIRDALRKFQLREADMDCVKWRQLAAQTSIAGLVLCGTLDESTNQVTAGFHPVNGGDAFDVPAFAMQAPEQGAQQVVQSFETYVRQLSLVSYCDDYIRSENWQQALDLCTQATELNPRSVSANYARGSALMNMDPPRNEEAFAAFEKVLEIEPIHADAMLAAGILASKLGRADVSQRYFTEYLAMNPGDENVRITIAHRLANEGDPAGAFRLVEAAASASDATASLLEYAGHFAMNAGLSMQQGGPANGNADQATEMFRKATQMYQRAVDMKGDSIDASVLRNLMLSYRNINETDRALQIGQRLTANSEDAQTWLIYSDVLRDANRNDESIRAMERAIALDPNLPGLGTRRAVTLLEAGRLAEAVAATKQAVAAGQMEASIAENISQQISARGAQHVNARRFDQAVTHFNAAREIGKSDLSIGMANFFHGFALVTQADAILRTATTAAPARQARPLLERAKVLLDGAGGYTAQAAKRAELLQNVQQYMEMADALIRSGR